jgi:hypothetical protein
VSKHRDEKYFVALSSNSTAQTLLALDMTMMGMVHSTSAALASREEAVNVENIAKIREEIGRLFSMNFSAETSENSSVALPTSRTASANDANTTCCNRRHVAQILEAASNTSSYVNEDSDSTRSTCDSPTFPQLWSSHDEDVASPSKQSRASSIVSHFKSGLGFRSRTGGSSSTTNDMTYSSRSSVKELPSDDEVRKPQPHNMTSARLHRSRSHKRSINIPVKGSRESSRKQLEISTITSDFYHYDSDDDDKEQLKRIYDMRTWDMYLRITASRKTASPVSIAPAVTSCHMTDTFSATTSAAGVAHFPAVPHHQLQASYYNPYNHQAYHFVEDDACYVQSSEHEMVFGDLED